MKLTIIFSTSILLLTALKVNAQAPNINYEYVCRNPNTYGFTQEQCDQWQQQNPQQEATPRKLGGERKRVYKIRLRDAATGNANQWSVFSPGDADREEWVVVTVIGQQVKVCHATNVMNKFWGTRQWYDHPATAIRICAVAQFDLTDCQTAQGDTIVLPEGKTIHDVQIDFKYSEGGALYTRSAQISVDTKPD